MTYRRKYMDEAAGPLGEAELPAVLPFGKSRRPQEVMSFRVEGRSARLIRLAHPRATSLFQRAFGSRTVTLTQVAGLATLLRHGDLPQNHVGVLTAIDAPTLSPLLRKGATRGSCRAHAVAKGSARQSATVYAHGYAVHQSDTVTIPKGEPRGPDATQTARSQAFRRTAENDHLKKMIV
ncbi:hypothetical protein [Chelativorans sp. Marseille-P2723]|uniref:hypothetical protein n=1 Tax=Chelativorans sp. Marseille-P2723 TaxID=2709133 RepID=UPI00156DE9CF|nr:hypothetical protein [Chelativorans sp. Marseille-P2723]